jgi:hypothetical protein
VPSCQIRRKTLYKKNQGFAKLVLSTIPIRERISKSVVYLFYFLKKISFDPNDYGTI